MKIGVGSEAENENRYRERERERERERRTGIGHGDFAAFIGVEPDLPFSTLEDARGEPLL